TALQDGVLGVRKGGRVAAARCDRVRGRETRESKIIIKAGATVVEADTGTAAGEGAVGALKDLNAVDVGGDHIPYDGRLEYIPGRQHRRSVRAADYRVGLKWTVPSRDRDVLVAVVLATEHDFVAGAVVRR